MNYWDNNDYNELTLQANLGYRYKDIKQSWGLITTAEQNLLGGSRYNQNYAATLEYSRKISNQWQISGSLAHLQKNDMKTKTPQFTITAMLIAQHGYYSTNQNQNG